MLADEKMAARYDLQVPEHSCDGTCLLARRVSHTGVMDAAGFHLICCRV